MRGEGRTQLAMVCPACKSRNFEIYFVGGTVVPCGSVWVVCLKCGSYWIGEINLEEGHLKQFPPSVGTAAST